ncbi:MAG: hypothetical protein UW84_C0008G0008 [Candidatus Collierbacteria bacterium GW2011_GWA2_44_99]|uniref:Uncharacterized protein n=1 Tax=Candidatus Collierbacteria bacterium GW2011_GWA2_44_99 TaxID=1618380 RepID=A0A0G1N0J6_9BACT|nr:MAG: hypothetical protein UW84_C0008G0008 [Candidatus Collierbacteria bacterium GW2011_GWA2_44_99]
MKKLNVLSKLFLSLAMVVGVLFSAVQGVSAYNERTIICSGGAYFDKYGPGQYWYEHGNQGWCHNPNNWCENGQCSKATTRLRQMPHIRLPITAEAATASRSIRMLTIIDGSRCLQRAITIRL